MHELSIAENILEIVNANLEGHGPAAIRSVKVRIGELAGVIPESLEFCFAAITKGTAMESAKLEIERTDIVAHCETCGADSAVKGLIFRCPSCSGPNIKIVSGDELRVVEIEVDDESEVLP